MSLFSPKYHLYSDDNPPALLGSFYRKATYDKALADYRRSQRVAKAKQDGTYFRIAVPYWASSISLRWIYNIVDSELISTEESINGCHIEYISPSRKHIALVQQDGEDYICLRQSKPNPTHFLVAYNDPSPDGATKTFRREVFSHESEAKQFAASHPDSNIVPVIIMALPPPNSNTKGA